MIINAKYCLIIRAKKALKNIQLLNFLHPIKRMNFGNHLENHIII